ncbi:MAG: molybdenum cofactor biosynthesis protein MoaE [Rickettsiales bacterium]
MLCSSAILSLPFCRVEANDDASLFIRASAETLSIQKAADFVDAAEMVNMFVGKVRNHNMGKAVNAVSYDVFALCLNVFQEICAEAAAQFGRRLRLYIEHYKGKLEIEGGISVIIAVGSPTAMVSLSLPLPD